MRGCTGHAHSTEGSRAGNRIFDALDFCSERAEDVDAACGGELQEVGENVGHLVLQSGQLTHASKVDAAPDLCRVPGLGDQLHPADQVCRYAEYMRDFVRTPTRPSWRARLISTT